MTQIKKGIHVSELSYWFVIDGYRLLWARDSLRGRAKAGDVAGWVAERGYRFVSLRCKRFPVHWIVFAIANGRWPESEVDHRDGDTRNNSPGNLREATRTQQMSNTAIRKNNTSGVKGVSWDSEKGRWVAQLSIGGERLMKRFKDKEAAANQYRQWAEQKFGEFACTHR